MKIKSNFLVISNYNNIIDWVPRYTNNYLIYDQSENAVLPKSINPKKVIKNAHLGHNIYDYCTYIIDHYSKLPECVIFATGNIFPRHVSQSFFDSVMNNAFFTPIEDFTRHRTKWPVSFISSDGGYCEINNSWYLHHHPTKYFSSFDDFLGFCFVNPNLPRYARFAPGANYIVPKANILKLSKQFYINLKFFVSHCNTAIPGESHIIERALYLLWQSNYIISDKMNKIITDKSAPVPQNKISNNQPLSSILTSKLESATNSITELLNSRSHLSCRVSPSQVNELKKMRIYDVFTFFNEIELLEIRLAMLDRYVDYFVLVESTETFSGKRKKLYYEKNKHLFKKYHHKIIHHVTSDTPSSEDELRKRLLDATVSDQERQIIQDSLTSDNVPKGQLHWLKEFYQKESIKKALVNLNDEDVCFISDVDEIWNPAAIIDFNSTEVFKLEQLVYIYYLNNRSSEPWAGTLTTKYSTIKKNCLNHLRTKSKTKYTYVPDGGWHFSFQGGEKRVKVKIESYGHQEFNTVEVKSSIADRIRMNKDFIGRKFKFWIDESELPEFLLRNKSKYKHMFK